MNEIYLPTVGRQDWQKLLTDSVLLESRVHVITRGYASAAASVLLAGRTQSKRDQVADEWLRPALSNARVAGRLVYSYTAMEGTHARSCV